MPRHSPIPWIAQSFNEILDWLSFMRWLNSQFASLVPCRIRSWWEHRLMNSLERMCGNHTERLKPDEGIHGFKTNCLTSWCCWQSDKPHVARYLPPCYWKLPNDGATYPGQGILRQCVNFSIPLLNNSLPAMVLLRFRAFRHQCRTMCRAATMPTLGVGEHEYMGASLC